MKLAQPLSPIVYVLFLILAACGPAPVSSPPNPAVAASKSPPIAPTPTRDPCGLEYVADVVKPINDVMLQFDDYATLAQYADKAQLPQIIPNMQTIRRVAGSRTVPECMADLQRQQVAYMDATLRTLLEFAKPDPKAGTIATGVVQAQYFHQAYALELARLLHVTPVAPTVAVTGTP
jgi:hypothetical protein